MCSQDQTMPEGWLSTTIADYGIPVIGAWQFYTTTWRGRQGHLTVLLWVLIQISWFERFTPNLTPPEGCSFLSQGLMIVHAQPANAAGL